MTKKRNLEENIEIFYGLLNNIINENKQLKQLVDEAKDIIIENERLREKLINDGNVE